ncbi:hypothetical protein ITJ57_16245 [Plantibacter sp. VKM Ac-2880]|uniref:hypothetical protein n=1 Tax=Plantibacter sp. VKM Ac-2880 TaxID=2783827 RepID=UPI00188E1675|nr:hypothetical protein [Plantibacter sp. VKM Ac-2880]MBF4570320.1 hypothetical protein [Plantibacter sp. VKM Ac-2880]
MTQNVQEATPARLPSLGTTAPEPPVGRWNASSRYGASLVAVVLGGYLAMRAGLNVMWLQSDADVIATLLLQFFVGGAVLVAGALIAPVSLARRVLASVVVVAGLVVHAFGSATVTNATTPFLLYGSMSVTLGAFTAAAVWLIVRGRSLSTFALLLAFAAVPVLTERLTHTGWSGVTREDLMTGVSAAIGVGVAWAAAAVDGARSR